MKREAVVIAAMNGVAKHCEFGGGRRGGAAAAKYGRAIGALRR